MVVRGGQKQVLDSIIQLKGEGEENERIMARGMGVQTHRQRVVGVVVMVVVVLENRQERLRRGTGRRRGDGGGRRKEGRKELKEKGGVQGRNMYNEVQGSKNKDEGEER